MIYIVQNTDNNVRFGVVAGIIAAAHTDQRSVIGIKNIHFKRAKPDDLVYVVDDTKACDPELVWERHKEAVVQVTKERYTLWDKSIKVNFESESFTRIVGMKDAGVVALIEEAYLAFGRHGCCTTVRDFIQAAMKLEIESFISLEDGLPPIVRTTQHANWIAFINQDVERGKDAPIFGDKTWVCFRTGHSSYRGIRNVEACLTLDKTGKPTMGRFTSASSEEELDNQIVVFETFVLLHDKLQALASSTENKE